MENSSIKRIVVGVSGASGSKYADRLMEELRIRGIQLHIIFTEQGRKVFAHETGRSVEDFYSYLKTIDSKHKSVHGADPILYDTDDLFAAIASGSYQTDAMIILPCSMHSLCGIANGSLPGLIGRAADVCLKEKRKMIIVPRETPLHSIHLRAMLQLSDMGATILPAMPGFYHNPQTIEEIINFIVARILQTLDIPSKIIQNWGDQNETTT